MSPQPLAATETATLDAVASFLAERGLGRAAEVLREDSGSQESEGRGCNPGTSVPQRGGAEEPALAASLRRLTESLGVGPDGERLGKENVGPQGCADDEPWLDSMLEKVVAWTAQAASADEVESRLLADALQAAGLEEAASAAVPVHPKPSANVHPAPPPLPAPPSEAYRADRPGAPLPDGSKDEYRDDGDPGYRVLHLSELDLLAELREKYRATLATVVAADAVGAGQIEPPQQQQECIPSETPSTGLAATAAAALGAMAEAKEQAEAEAQPSLGRSDTLPLEELTAAMAAEREADMWAAIQRDRQAEGRMEDHDLQQSQQQQEQEQQEQQEQMRLLQQQQHLQLQLQQQQLQLQQQQLQQQFAQQQASLLQSSAMWTAPRALASTKTRTASRRPGYRYAPSGDPFYPACYEGVTFDSFPLRIVYERDRTGFEESKEFPIQINSVIAARYQVISYLGQAAFSRAVQCLDLHSGEMVCMKIIKNDKDFIDQSLDEIKLLKIINANTGNVDDKHCLRLIDYIYHKEHLIIITELLRDNLYEFSKYDRERGEDPYFTLGHLQRITRQLLVALQYVHSLWLIHADLKPENVLVKSYSRCEVKLIDFGSSCFVDDRLSSYVQSRSYRAPEVILGLPYDQKVDIWSLGCVLSELWTGYVLFQNDSVQSLLARVEGIIGKIPVHMMSTGRFVPQYFTQDGRLFKEVPVPPAEAELPPEQQPRIQLLLPKRSSLHQRLRTDDEAFVDFLGYLLRIDPATRPTAAEALQHPWLSPGRYSDGL